MDRVNVLWILSLTFIISDAYLYYSGRASSNSQMHQNKKKVVIENKGKLRLILQFDVDINLIMTQRSVAILFLSLISR